MMVRRIAQVLSVAVVATVAGCGVSPTARFYTLDSTAAPDGTAAVSYAIAVGPVSVPPCVDRPQFVVQVAPNQVAFDEFNRWAAPLDDGVARAVAGDLGVLLGTTRVGTGPLPGFDPAYRVTIDVQRFESNPGEGVLVDAVWAVHAAASGRTQGGRTLAREAVQGKDFDALAAAHSRALAKVSSDIASAIRAQAGQRR